MPVGNNLSWNTSTDGTVTSVSVVEANGIGGTVANPTTTPSITFYFTPRGVTKVNEAGQLVPASRADILALIGETLDIETVNMQNGTITKIPTNPTDIVNKLYIDGHQAGLNVLTQCRYATTENIALNNTTDRVDGGLVTDNDRILALFQTDPVENGVWVANTTGAWTRASDLPDGSDFESAYTFVTAGDENAYTAFTVSGSGTTGTDPMTWSIFSIPVEYSAGVGIEIVGHVISTVIATKSRLGAVVIGSGLTVSVDGQVDVSVDGVTIQVIDDKLVVQAATVTTLGAVYSAVTLSYATPRTLVATDLPLNATSLIVNTSATNNAMTVPSGYTYSSTGYGNSATVFTLAANSSFAIKRNLDNTIDIIGIAAPYPMATTTVAGINLSNNTIRYNFSTTLVASELPLNMDVCIVNTNSSSQNITLTAPSSYTFDSIGFGNTTTQLAVAPSSSVTVRKNANNTISVIGNNGTLSNYTRYNYPISCKNTPTFVSGEEYLVATASPNGDTDYDLTFAGINQAGATAIGLVNIKFSLLRNSSSEYSTSSILVHSITSAGSANIVPADVKDLFTFTAYNLTQEATINGVALTVGTVIYTIKLNTTLGFVGTVNSLYGSVSTELSAPFVSFANPYNTALLGVVNTALVGTSAVIPYLIVPTTTSASMGKNSIPTYTNGKLTNSGLLVSNIVKKYTRYFYVDPNNGSNTNTTTNNGSYNAPFLTVAYAQTIATTGTAIVLMGLSTETAFTFTKSGVAIIAPISYAMLSGFSNKVTINNTSSATSITTEGIAFNGGLDIASTNVGSNYIFGGQIGATGFNKADAGLCEFYGVVANLGANNISNGTFNAYNGKATVPIVTGTATKVTLDNVVNSGNSTVASGNSLTVYDCTWTALASGNAISSVSGATVVISNTGFARPNGTLASLSLAGNYSISSSSFDKAASTLTGTNQGIVQYFDKVGILNPSDVIDDQLKMCVIENGELKLQDVPPQPVAHRYIELCDFKMSTDEPLISNGNIDFTTAAIDTHQTLQVNGSGQITGFEDYKTYKITLVLNVETSDALSTFILKSTLTGGVYVTEVEASPLLVGKQQVVYQATLLPTDIAVLSLTFSDVSGTSTMLSNSSIIVEEM